MSPLLPNKKAITRLQGTANLDLTEEQADELKAVMAALGVTDFGDLIMAALPLLQEYLETHPDFHPLPVCRDMVLSYYEPGIRPVRGIDARVIPRRV